MHANPASFASGFLHGDTLPESVPREITRSLFSLDIFPGISDSINLTCGLPFAARFRGRVLPRVTVFLTAFSPRLGSVTVIGYRNGYLSALVTSWKRMEAERRDFKVTLAEDIREIKAREAARSREDWFSESTSESDARDLGDRCTEYRDISIANHNANDGAERIS